MGVVLLWTGVSAPALKQDIRPKFRKVESDVTRAVSRFCRRGKFPPFPLCSLSLPYTYLPRITSRTRSIDELFDRPSRQVVTT